MKLKSLAPLLASALVSSALVMPAFADEPKTPHLDKREAHQEKMIEKGQKSGQLTDQEAAELQARQDKLKADEAAAKADGKVTHKEKVELNKEASQNKKEIRKLKHNKDKKSAE